MQSLFTPTTSAHLSIQMTLVDVTDNSHHRTMSTALHCLPTQVPVALSELTNALVTDASPLEEQGLFRKSGSLPRMRKAKRTWETTGRFPPVGVGEGFVTAHDLAGLIKEFFREQPSGVLDAIRDVLMDICAAAQTGRLTHAEQVVAFSCALRLLPSRNVDVVSYLFSW